MAQTFATTIQLQQCCNLVNCNATLQRRGIVTLQHNYSKIAVTFQKVILQLNI